MTVLQMVLLLYSTNHHFSSFVNNFLTLPPAFDNCVVTAVPSSIHSLALKSLLFTSDFVLICVSLHVPISIIIYYPNKVSKTIKCQCQAIVIIKFCS